MNPYFEVIKLKYELDGSITAVVKAKVDDDKRPGNGWWIDFYDEDGVSVCQHSFLEQTYHVDAAKNENFTSSGCGEKVMQRVKKVVVTRNRG